MASLIYDIVGCGAAVKQFHVPLLLHFKRKHNLKVRGCFDLNLGNAEEIGRLLGASIAGSPADAKGLNTVSAALIATPPDSHVGFAEKYLSQGKSVLIEKPFVTQSNDAKKLVALASEKSAKIFVGNFKRFYPSVLIARKIIEHGWLGEIQRVEASEGMRWEWPAASRYFVESPYGGVIYDTGAHLLDIVLFVLFPDHEEINWQIESLEKTPAAEPSHVCRAKMKIWNKVYAGLEFDFKLSRAESLARIVKIYGTKGCLLVPTAFAYTPILQCENSDSILRSIPAGDYALDETGCFLLEHQQLIDHLTESTNKHSILDGSNFVSLIGILETLSNAGK